MSISFIDLKKNNKKDMSALPACRLAIVGDCATQHLAQAIRGYGYEEGRNLEILDTDYNQILPQCMDPESELYRYKPELVLIAMCSPKLYERYLETPPKDRDQFAEQQMAYMEQIWSLLRSHGQDRILQFNFPENNDAVFGNYGTHLAFSYIYQLRKLNYLMMERAAAFGNVYLVDLVTLQQQMGAAFVEDKLYYAAKMPFSLEGVVAIARQVVQIIHALKGSVKKCVVLDLDNTLWGGVIGDDGLEGIQIGELGVGHAFQALQQWLKELTGRGILLAVCSKNDEEKAKEPFEKHPEMVLRLSDIAMFVANWEDKASNIQAIQKTLNIGMDSLVFLDDNPFERNLVRSMLPEITVPELPEDPAGVLSFLQAQNYFETVSYSEEDQNRTRQYIEEAQRVLGQAQFASYEEYLTDLHMVGEGKPVDAFHLPRVAQLSQRSNQFNLRTIRYTEEDLQKKIEDPDYRVLYFTLRDKYGDHGLISAMILKRQQEEVFIENWFMSCRVLKRTMEAYIINQMMAYAKELGAARVLGEYCPTPKNAMVEKIYETLGFTPVGEGKYLLELSSANALPTFISEEVG